MGLFAFNRARLQQAQKAGQTAQPDAPAPEDSSTKNKSRAPAKATTADKPTESPASTHQE